MSGILDGWSDEAEAKHAHATLTGAELDARLEAIHALARVKYAIEEAEAHGLCIYCGSRMLPAWPGGPLRCYCRADD
jgi:hypothetical protein